MELRSSSQRNEYKELKRTLTGMGFYEEGMELQEMRQILEALEQSECEMETRLLENDIHKAIRESELDCLPAGVMNSTMKSQHGDVTDANYSHMATFGTSYLNSASSSPDMPSERIIVHAEVHHSMEWIPPEWNVDNLQRKRLASSLSPPLSSPLQLNDESTNDQHPNGDGHELEPNAKRHQPEIVHEVIGPVSMLTSRHDSGVNMGNDDHSSPDNNNSGLDANGNYQYYDNRAEFSTSSAAMSLECTGTGNLPDYYDEDHSEPSL